MLITIMISWSLYAQDAHITAKLYTTGGLPYKDLKVAFKSRGDSKVYRAVTNSNGICFVDLPIGNLYDMLPENTVRTFLVKVEDIPSARLTFEYRYDPGSQELDETYAFNEEEIRQWKEIMKRLPDTTRYKSAQNLAPDDYFVILRLALRNLNDQPLVSENIYITGRAFKKTFAVHTDSFGRAKLMIPKGDTFDLNFKYDRHFEEFFYPLNSLATRADYDYAYEGTAAIELRKKEKETRLIAEKKRQALLEKEFNMYIKRESITMLEGKKKELQKYMSGQITIQYKTIIPVLDRNKQWNNILFVCDVTGSMSPYEAELLQWFKLQTNKNIQYIFFNDGDGISDISKKTGKTGGIYYYQTPSADSLLLRMAYVSAMGNGGDIAENNMEALISGTRMAKKPFKEVIMIADNLAPVKDIQLLEQFTTPVHIILCGTSQEIEPDYLKIAWKTGGSIHTQSEDIYEISKMTDGQEITIENKIYRLMKGRFILLDK